MTLRIAPVKHKGIPMMMEGKETMGAAVVDEISIKIGPMRVRSLCLSLETVEERRIAFWDGRMRSKAGYRLTFRGMWRR